MILLSKRWPPSIFVMLLHAGHNLEISVLNRAKPISTKVIGRLLLEGRIWIDYNKSTPSFDIYFCKS